MKNSKNKRPLESSMKRDGDIWWTQINNKWVKCIPYNIKEEKTKISQGDDDLDKDQFDQLMNRFDTLEADVKSVKTDVSIIKTDLNNLTTIVKKNHPDDFE